MQAILFTERVGIEYAEARNFLKFQFDVQIIFFHLQ